MLKIDKMSVKELRIELLKAKKKIKELKDENEKLYYQMQVLKEKYLYQRSLVEGEPGIFKLEEGDLNDIRHAKTSISSQKTRDN
jgi:hypothetical protein